MAYRPHGRATVDPDNPRAWAHCDRCYDLVNHADLRWQFRFAGPQAVNTYKLVCERCLDQLQPQEHTIVLPPDPVPIKNPRPGTHDAAIDYLSTDDGFYIDDDLGDDLVKGGENV
jgi:hypothetical protein